MNKWLLIRIIIIGISFLISFFQKIDIKYSINYMDLKKLIIIFIVSIIGVIFVIGLQILNYREKIWIKPSWCQNPFNFKQPLQFFHFAGYFSLISGIASIMNFLINKNSLSFEAIIPLCMGIGVIVGVHFSVILYKNKFIITGLKN